MKNLYSFLPSFPLLCLLSIACGRAQAQNNATLNGGATNGGTLLIKADAASNPTGAYLQMSSSPNNNSISYVAGANAPITGVAHDFLVMDGTGWPSVLKVMRNGRVGLGFHALDEALLGIYGGQGTYSRGIFSVDELGSGLNSAINGSTCIGFNAVRQRMYDGAVRFGYDGTAKNGGAVIWADMDGALGFTTMPTNGGAVGNAGGAQWLSPAQVMGAYQRMRINAIGQVQIGRVPSATAPNNSPHTDYKLAVDGKLVARSVFVTQSNWADFVFAPDYTLLPLPDLETYLRQNRHLPAIPSAAEVAKNGIDLGTMETKLLQSLEELTLHVIELGKQNQRLQAEVTALAARVNQATAPAAAKQ